MNPPSATDGATPRVDEPDFQSLPEPARLVAADTYRRLRREGRDHAEAAQVAADQAREWEASRAPGAQES